MMSNLRIGLLAVIAFAIVACGSDDPVPGEPDAPARGDVSTFEIGDSLVPDTGVDSRDVEGDIEGDTPTDTGDADLDSSTDAEADAERDADAVSDAVSDADAVSDSDADSGVDVLTDADALVDADTSPDADVAEDVVPDAEPDVAPDVEPDVPPCDDELSCTPACEAAAGRADYSGCSFWAVDLDNTLDAGRTGPGEAATAVVLTNVGEAPASIELTDAFGVLVALETLAPGETVMIPIPRADRIGTRIEASAFHVESDEPLLAYQFTPLERAGTSSGDATLLIPTAALDEDYRVMTWPGGGYDQRGFAAVVATEDDTTVAIDVPEGIEPGVDFTGLMRSLAERTVRSDGSALLTRTLRRGEVFNVQSTPFGDLSGARVTADRPVAVFAGSRCSTIPDRIPKCDHLEHAMLPLANQGRTYLGPGSPPRDSALTWYRVVSNYDGTELEHSEDPGVTHVLDAGEVLTLSSAAPVLFEASAPVLVGMFLVGAEADAGGVGDPSFTILPPTEQFRRDYSVLVPSEFETDTLTIIRRALTEINLDGAPISGPVYAGPGGWEVLHIEVDDGTHTLDASSRGFGVIATGYDEEVSYAYAGGLGLDKLAGSDPIPLDSLCEGGELPGTPCDTGAFGVCAPGHLRCDPGGPAECVTDAVARDEICDGRDDDCDGITDPGCDGLSLNRLAPEGDRAWAVEGEDMRFEVDAAALPEGTPITWRVDDDVFVDATATVFDWRPRQFDEGARVVTAEADVDGRTVAVDWLVLITDAPTNAPVIWGYVTMRDGRVVPGLTFEATGGPSTGDESVLDGRGTYALPVEPGTYGISIDTVFHSRPSWFARGIVNLVGDVVVDRENVQRDVVLPVSRVFGDIAVEGGEPLPGATVNFNGSCFACSGGATADDEANYETWLYDGTYRSTATPPADTGLPARLEEGITVDADRRYDIRFAPVFEVTGVVLDQYEVPVPEVTIPFEGPRAESDVRTDAEGRFSVRLPADTYRVELDTVFNPRPPNIGRGIVTLIDALVVDADTPEQTIRLPNTQVTGVVEAGDTGEPISGVTLNFNGSCFACNGSATSGEGGSYSLPLLDGTYRVEVTPPVESGYVNFDMEGIAIGGGDLVFDVEAPGPAWVLSGTLIDPRGATVAGVTLESAGRTESESATDGDGRFELRLLEDDYSLSIDTVFNSRPVDFPRGIIQVWSGTVSSDRDEEIVAPISYVTGRVQDEAGDPVPGTRLDFNGSCFACSQSATTDDAGEFTAQVFQGTYRIVVTPPDPLPPVTLEGVDLTEVDSVVDVEF